MKRLDRRETSPGMLFWERQNEGICTSWPVDLLKKLNRLICFKLWQQQQQLRKVTFTTSSDYLKLAQTLNYVIRVTKSKKKKKSKYDSIHSKV